MWHDQAGIHRTRVRLASNDGNWLSIGEAFIQAVATLHTERVMLRRRIDWMVRETLDA
jgi:hypothetical protein